MKLQDIFESTISGKHFSAAMSTIISYLEKKLGTKLIKIPGIEHFKNSSDSGYGLRYVFDGSTKSIRFNWKNESGAGNSTKLSSINYWDGSSHDPLLTIKAEGISLAQILPALVSVLVKPRTGKFKVFPAVIGGDGEPAVVAEAKRGEFTAETALSDFLRKLKAGKSFTRSEFIGMYHISNVGIFDTALKVFSEKFETNSKRLALPEDADIDSLEDKILSKAGTLEVTRGGSNETYGATAGEREIAEKVPFEETLEHLRGLVKSLIAGAFNALFVAGRGGTGKTQTVEDALAEEGLMDGIGYFKNTGTASPAGLYALLYHHRKDIILFDDSDGALADQDARNIIKAATDTKKRRKLVWNKKSPFIFDPDIDDPEKYEDDSTMAPKYFDFEGRIIFISNLPLNKLDPDGALRTRAFVINVDPTDQELFERMEKILHQIKLEDGLSLSKEKRREVLEVVKQSKRRGDVSLRKLVRALNLAASGAPNWEKLVELYA